MIYLSTCTILRGSLSRLAGGICELQDPPHPRRSPWRLGFYWPGVRWGILDLQLFLPVVVTESHYSGCVFPTSLGSRRAWGSFLKCRRWGSAPGTKSEPRGPWTPTCSQTQGGTWMAALPQCVYLRMPTHTEILFAININESKYLHAPILTSTRKKLISGD